MKVTQTRSESTAQAFRRDEKRLLAIIDRRLKERSDLLTLVSLSYPMEGVIHSFLT